MDSNKPAITGVKKRQQIQQANKAVFIWVALAGVVIAIAIVLSQFMVKQLLFNIKVINTETKTNAVLIENAEVYAPLRTEVSKLISNKELTELRLDKNENGDNALQVVIDAMPTEDDRLSLAASLQQRIFSRSGVRIEQLSVSSGDSLAGDPAVAVSQTEGVVEVPFTFEVSGTYEQIKKLFNDMQLSIRPISVTAVKLSGENSNMTAEIQAKTYYSEPATTDMKKETLKP
jgi:Tfp pilus assembly protein PilO